MARILKNRSDARPHPAKDHALTVNGVRFTNAASKFWRSLLDEVAEDYPSATTLVFETLGDVELNRGLLFPENALQRELDAFRTLEQVERKLRETLAECDLYGPPGAVRLRLFAGDSEIKECELPLDCVDSEIFAYLLAWLMEWAEIPEISWNNDRSEGAFLTGFPGGAERNLFKFELTREHVSEGLYHWRLVVRKPDKYPRLAVDSDSSPRE